MKGEDTQSRPHTSPSPQVQSEGVYLEFGGGLGDVFNQMYHNGAYNVLRDLRQGELARVALFSHNPSAKELFEWHPKRAQFRIIDCGYFCIAEEEKVEREKWGLPMVPQILPTKDKFIEFFPNPVEWMPDNRNIAYIINERTRRAQRRLLIEDRFPGRRQSKQLTDAEEWKIVVIAAAASEPSRNLPPEFVDSVCKELITQGYLPVQVGKSYPRFDRREYHSPLAVDLIDQLTVPATAILLQQSWGLITCHSALNILAWHLRKPQWLLYSKSIYERHIKNRDPWAFGIGRDDTIHCLFGHETDILLHNFCTAMGKTQPES
jgi:hypothetical protein